MNLFLSNKFLVKTISNLIFILFHQISSNLYLIKIDNIYLFLSVFVYFKIKYKVKQYRTSSKFIKRALLGTSVETCLCSSIQNI
jgi:hypothetical protein